MPMMWDEVPVNEDRRHDVVLILRAAVRLYEDRDMNAFLHAVDDVVERVRAKDNGDREVDEVIQLLAITAANGLHFEALAASVRQMMAETLAQSIKQTSGDPELAAAVLASAQPAPTVDEILDSMEVDAIAPLHGD